MWVWHLNIFSMTRVKQEYLRMNRNVKNRTFGHVRPVKIQISLRICSLIRIFPDISLDNEGYMRTTKTLIRLYEHTG